MSVLDSIKNKKLTGFKIREMIEKEHKNLSGFCPHGTMIYFSWFDLVEVLRELEAQKRDEGNLITARAYVVLREKLEEASKK